MAQDRNLTTLGGGEIYLNNVDVGYLNGAVTLISEGEPVDLMPNNQQGPIRRFKASERLRLTASLFQIQAANMRLAMGHSTAVSASQSFPAFDPSSFSPAASSSWDVVNIGGDKSVNEVSLRFEHQRPKDQNSDEHKVVVVMYSVVSNFNMTIPFDRTEISIGDVEFEALIQPTRAAGDQFGFVAVQVQDAG
jgi:hypothetical protein